LAQPAAPPLRALAARHGVRIGAAVNPAALKNIAAVVSSPPP